MKTLADHYIKKHTRSPHLWYVRDVPKDVRAVIGQTRWKQSLGTGSRPAAIHVARSLAAEHDRLITAKRSESGKIDVLAGLSPEERGRIQDAGGVQGYLEWLDSRAHLAARKADDADMWRADARDPDPESPDADEAMERAVELDAGRRVIERHLGGTVSTVNVLGLPTVALRVRKHYALADAIDASLPEPEITLLSVFKRWEAAKQPTAPEQFAYPVKLFESLHGGLPVTAITKDHVREFRDAVKLLPKAAGGKFKGMSMSAMIDEAERRGLPRLSVATAAKYHRSIGTILGFAVDEGYIDESPAEGIRFHHRREKFSTTKREKRRSFAPAELALLLDKAETAWTGKDARENRWFLRLMVYTGARPEELAQLAPRDVKAIGGHLSLSLHDEGDNVGIA